MENDVIETTRITYNKTAIKYAETHFEFSSMKKQYQDFMNYCRRGSLILDVGCGPGRDVKYFIENGYQVIGIDYSDGMIEEAKKRVPEANFQKMDMRSLIFGKHTFDGIWCCASITHIPKSEIKLVLKKFKRILKPNGILYITTKMGIGEELKNMEGGYKKFYVYYTEKEFENIVKECGFKILKNYLNVDDKKQVWINIFTIIMGK